MRKKLLESTTWYREEEGNNEQAVVEREFTESSWESQKNVEGERGGKQGKKRAGVRRGKVTKPRGRGNKVPTKAVMFVPFTKGSQLAKQMRENEQMMEQMSGYRLKIVERGGIKLESILVKRNPWEGECCERENVPIM